MSCKLTDRVEIWTVSVDPAQDAASVFRDVIAPDEMRRADRYRFENHRLSFTIARGALRILLGRYAEIPPSSVEILSASNGKPYVERPSNLKFSASRSGSLAVFAFAKGCEIGVDVESIRTMPDCLDIAGRFFCKQEAAELIALPESQREAAFFHLWALKEAVVKESGEGLRMPLDSFEVTSKSRGLAAIVACAQHMGPPAAWRLHTLNLPPGFAAALAYRGAERSVVVMPPVTASELLTGPPTSSA